MSCVDIQAQARTAGFSNPEIDDQILLVLSARATLYTTILVRNPFLAPSGGKNRASLSEPTDPQFSTTGPRSPVF